MNGMPERHAHKAWHAHACRGMIAGEVLFHEQPTLLSMVGALIICCAAVGVTLYENRSQEPQKPQAGVELDTELGHASEKSEKSPLVGA